MRVFRVRSYSNSVVLDDFITSDFSAAFKAVIEVVGLSDQDDVISDFHITRDDDGNLISIDVTQMEIT